MESTGRRGRRPRRCVGLRLTGFQLFEVVDGLIRAEALKDDDVEDDEGAGVDDKEKQKLAEEKMDVEDETKRKPNWSRGRRHQEELAGVSVDFA
jgi:hypothetical protein